MLRDDYKLYRRPKMQECGMIYINQYTIASISFILCIIVNNISCAHDGMVVAHCPEMSRQVRSDQAARGADR